MAEPSVEWHPFDYDKPATAPPPALNYGPLWIVETFYTGGVSIGFFDGYTFRTFSGSDDCCVTYWAEIEYPEPPEGWDANDEDGGDGNA